MKKVKEKLLRAGLIASLTMSNLSMNVYATGLKDSKLYTGTVKLLGDIMPLLLVVEGLLAGVICAKEGMKYQAADDQEKPRHIKNIWTTIGVGIVVMVVSSLIPVIFGYYK